MTNDIGLKYAKKKVFFLFITEWLKKFKRNGLSNVSCSYKSQMFCTIIKYMFILRNILQNKSEQRGEIFFNSFYNICKKEWSLYFS